MNDLLVKPSLTFYTNSTSRLCSAPAIELGYRKPVTRQVRTAALRLIKEVSPKTSSSLKAHDDSSCNMNDLEAI